MWEAIISGVIGLAGIIVNGIQNKKNRESQEGTNTENADTQKDINESNVEAVAEQNAIDREWQTAENDKAIEWQTQENELQRAREDAQNEYAKQIDERNFQFDIQKWEADQQLQQQIFEREDTSYQRTVNDMRNAGLNPLAMNGTNGAGGVVSTTAPHQDVSTTEGTPGQIVKGDAIQGHVAEQQSWAKQSYKNDMDYLAGLRDLGNAVQGAFNRKQQQDNWEAQMDFKERMAEKDNPKWAFFNTLMDNWFKMKNAGSWNGGQFKFNEGMNWKDMLPNFNFQPNLPKIDFTNGQEAVNDAQKKLEEIWQREKNRISKEREESARIYHNKPVVNTKQTAFKEGTFRAKVTQKGLNWYNKHFKSW